MHSTQPYSLSVAILALALAAANAPAEVITTGYVNPDPVTANSSTYLVIGDAIDGTLTIDANGSDHDVTCDTAMIAYNTDGVSAAVTVEGSPSSLTSQYAVHVGWEGDATLNVLSGGIVTSDSGSIGVKSGSVSSATIDGSDSSWTMATTFQSFSVGYQGDGTLAITGGGSVTTQVGVNAGYYSGSTGRVIVDGDLVAQPHRPHRLVVFDDP